MNGRKQYVNIDGCHSSIRDITLGVPQGSILGPVLFLIFINDLPSALQDTVADIYADDTTVSYSTDYRLAPWAVSDSLQSDLNKLQKWSDNNKMILNEKKTKTMLATGKWLEKRMGHQQLQVKLNATELDQVNSQKLLGVTIDSKLSFDEHIDDLCRKVSQRIAVLKRIKKFLPFQQRIAYYNAMIKQDMLYASVVWSSCSLGNLQRILRLQKRAARVILDADTRANSVELFKILNWLPVHLERRLRSRPRRRGRKEDFRRSSEPEESSKIMLGTFAFVCFAIFYGCECGIPPRNYDLQFPNQGVGPVTDFVHILGMPSLTQFTICFLMKAEISGNTSGTPFSYAVPGSNNELLIHNHNDFQLFIGGQVRDTNVNDNVGQAHHICTTWQNSNGEWKFFKDGKLVKTERGFQVEYEITAGGSLVLGQRQTAVWPNLNFEEKSSFIGTLTNVNVWSYVLSENSIENLAKYCFLVEGDIYAWSDFIYGVRGNTGITSPSFCQPSGRPDGGSFRGV
ncbi:hypothetical protein ACROYT_G016477 [Oculina patagonica]